VWEYQSAMLGYKYDTARQSGTIGSYHTVVINMEILSQKYQYSTEACSKIIKHLQGNEIRTE